MGENTYKALLLAAGVGLIGYQIGHAVNETISEEKRENIETIVESFPSYYEPGDGYSRTTEHGTLYETVLKDVDGKPGYDLAMMSHQGNYPAGGFQVYAVPDTGSMQTVAEYDGVWADKVANGDFEIVGKQYFDNLEQSQHWSK